MDKNFLKLGIIGYPLAHSISPIIQATALESVGKSGSYKKFEVRKENLPEQIKFFLDEGFSGFNVTIPYKVEILKYLDEIDPVAQAIGAVNTVKINENGKLLGFNTDIYGFKTAIPDAFKNIKNAVLLGCGGAALAVVFGLQELGVENLTIYARNIEKAHDFVLKIKDKIDMNIAVADLAKMTSLQTCDILINATPLGTKGENENRCPVAVEVLKTAKKELFVYDLVYNPAKTKLLFEAEKLGLNYINGLDMLILQGARAFEIWTGEKPSVEKMQTEAVRVLNI